MLLSSLPRGGICSKTVYEAVADGAEQIELGKRVVSSRAYLSWFNFKGGDQQYVTIPAVPRHHPAAYPAEHRGGGGQWPCHAVGTLPTSLALPA